MENDRFEDGFSVLRNFYEHLHDRNLTKKEIESREKILDLCIEITQDGSDDIIGAFRISQCG